MTKGNIFYYTKKDSIEFNKKVNEVKTHLNDIDWNNLKSSNQSSYTTT